MPAVAINGVEYEMRKPEGVLTPPVIEHETVLCDCTYDNEFSVSVEPMTAAPPAEVCDAICAACREMMADPAILAAAAAVAYLPPVTITVSGGTPESRRLVATSETFRRDLAGQIGIPEGRLRIVAAEPEKGKR